MSVFGAGVIDSPTNRIIAGLLLLSVQNELGTMNCIPTGDFLLLYEGNRAIRVALFEVFGVPFSTLAPKIRNRAND